MNAGEGERLEAERRKKFWRLIYLLAAAGGIGGFIFGFVHGRSEALGEPIGETGKIIASVALLVGALGGAFFSWRFFATVDEVEMADNLWASLVGFYIYGLGFPTWWALWWLGSVPEPSGWVIYAAAMIGACIVYIIRKWQAR